MSSLPTDEAYVLAARLPLHDLCSLNNVSRGWKTSLDSGGIWRRAVLNDSPYSDLARQARNGRINWREAAQRLCLRQQAIRHAAPHRIQSSPEAMSTAKFGSHFCRLDRLASVVSILNIEKRHAQSQQLQLQLPSDDTRSKLELTGFNDGVLSYYAQPDYSDGYGDVVFVEAPPGATYDCFGKPVQGVELRRRRHHAPPLVIAHTAERFAVLYSAQGSSKAFIYAGDLQAAPRSETDHPIAHIMADADMTICRPILKAFSSTTPGQNLAHYVSSEGMLYIVTIAHAGVADPLFWARNHGEYLVDHHTDDVPEMPASDFGPRTPSKICRIIEHYTLVTIDLSCTSARTCSAPPDTTPRTKPELNMTMARLPRRDAYNEGPVHESWSQLSLQRDERTGDLCIVDVRKVWVGGGSKQRRFATVVPWPAPDPVADETSDAAEKVRICKREEDKRDLHFDGLSVNAVPPVSQVLFSGYVLSARTFVDIVSSDMSLSDLRMRVAAAVDDDQEGPAVADADDLGHEEALVARLHGAGASGSRVAWCDIKPSKPVPMHAPRTIEPRRGGRISKWRRAKMEKAGEGFKAFLDEQALFWSFGEHRSEDTGSRGLGVIWWDRGCGLV